MSILITSIEHILEGLETVSRKEKQKMFKYEGKSKTLTICRCIILYTESNNNNKKTPMRPLKIVNKFNKV